MTTLQPARVDEVALTESRSLRAQYVTRVDVLEKVKALSLLPDGVHATTEGVAGYYEVPVATVESVVQRNREELEQNGLRTLRGGELGAAMPAPSKRRALALFDRRAVLNVGQLLTKSETARRVQHLGWGEAA